MATYTQSQIENVWFALNLNRLKPNNDMQSGAGLHNPNGSINMYKWLQDALDLLGNGSCGTSIGAVTLNGDAPLFTSTTCGATMNFTAGSGITLTGDGPTKSITIAASGGGSGDNIYNIDGTLIDNRIMTMNGKSISINNDPTFHSWKLNASSSQHTLGDNTRVAGHAQLYDNMVDFGGFTKVHFVGVNTLGATSGDDVTTEFTTSANTLNGIYATGYATMRSTSGSLGEVSLIMKSTPGQYPEVFLNLPTAYTPGYIPKLYMTPSVVSTGLGDNAIQYTYPLTSHVFSFSLNVNAQVNVDDVSTNLLITSADGSARRAIDVTISTRGSVGISFGNEIRIVIYKVSDDSIFYDTGAFIPSNTKGVIFSDSIDLALGSHESYYAKVTQIEGSSSENKGLCISLSTI